MEYRSYKDRREYLIEAVKRRRKKLKEMAVKLKGGKCQLCGYNRYIGALDFHHLEGSVKHPKYKCMRHFLAALGKDAFLKEIVGCKLVCSNCHRELHSI